LGRDCDFFGPARKIKENGALVWRGRALLWRMGLFGSEMGLSCGGAGLFCGER